MTAMETDGATCERPVLNATNQSGHSSERDHEKAKIIEKDHAYQAGGDVEAGNPAGLSAEHREYLMARHGTVDLNPLPTMDPADPLNWPAWKVTKELEESSVDKIADMKTETRQPDSCGLQCHDDYIHSSGYHSSLRSLLHGSWNIYHASLLSHEHPNSHLRGGSIVLEAHLEPLRSKTNLAHFHLRQLDM